MSQSNVTKQLKLAGMHCNGCEIVIEKKLKSMEGISGVKASYRKGMVTVTYDESKISLSAIKQEIRELEYTVTDGEEPPLKVKAGTDKVSYPQLAVIAVIMLGAALLIDRFGGFSFLGSFPEVKAGMSYAAIFVIGLLTSVHCVGMCGGICLSQCIGAKGEKNSERVRPSLLYNLGRVLSYTVIGGIVGALGSVISFNGFMRGAVALFAGVFMIIMGLNMLDLFPWLRKFSIRMPKFLVGRIQGRRNSPFYIGLINGFMPCGPLQAMQLYALSTGSFVQGAFSMFLFALGTTPLMFGFGAVSSLLSRKFTAKLMAASGILVIILGFLMFNTGLTMSGFLTIGGAGKAVKQVEASEFEPVIEDGYQIVEIEVEPRSYAPIVVKKGIPVRFNLHAKSENLTGCNYAIQIPEYGIQKILSEGDNIVEFTPEEAGVIPYSCWMGMIRSTIVVVEDSGEYDPADSGVTGSGVTGSDALGSDSNAFDPASVPNQFDSLPFSGGCCGAQN